jgi:hypothetical protein
MVHRHAHSPLRALAKKALLRVGVPVAVVGYVLYSMATYQTPEQRWRAQEIARLKRKIDEAMAPQRAAVDALIKKLEKDPVAIKHMKAMERMTLEEKRIYSRQVEDAWRKANGLD